MEYGSRNVLADPEVRDGVKRFTAWPTIPQVGAAQRFVRMVMVWVVGVLVGRRDAWWNRCL